MKALRVSAFAALLVVASFRPAAALPVQISGVVINPGDAGFAELTAALGSSLSGFSLVAFDLSSLSFNPTALLAVDDNVPAADNPSGLGGSGLDIDAIGGLAVGGAASYATGINGYVPGQRISAPSPSIAVDFETYLASAPASAKSVAAAGGTGGPGFLIGTSADALGAPNGGITGAGPTIAAAGWLSIGSGGQLSVTFSSAINRNGNIGGTIYDLVYWDLGGAGDNGSVFVDDAPIATPEPISFALMGAGLAGVMIRRRR